MDDELSFQIDGTPTEPTRVVSLGRPVDGRVRVREWTSDDWAHAVESEKSVADVWREIEHAEKGRRRISAAPMTIAQWMGLR